jgi:hypothetical protein
MLSLPFLSAIWLTLCQIVEVVERRFKAWTKPATSPLIRATAGDLIRTRSELVAENASYGSKNNLRGNGPQAASR